MTDIVEPEVVENVETVEVPAETAEITETVVVVEAPAPAVRAPRWRVLLPAVVRHLRASPFGYA